MEIKQSDDMYADRTMLYGIVFEDDHLLTTDPFWNPSRHTRVDMEA